MTFCGLRRPEEAVHKAAETPASRKGRQVFLLLSIMKFVWRALVQHIFAVFILAGIEYKEDAADIA